MRFREIDGLPGMPYDYQEEAYDAFFAEYDGPGRPQLVVMATGLGKSVTACLIAREVVRRGGRVLVVTHLDNLVEQLTAEFEYWGQPVAVEKAGRRALDMVAIGSPSSRCVVACVATLAGRRLASWPADYFDLIICDESHRSASRGAKARKRPDGTVKPASEGQYRAIFRHFGRARMLGMTATPNRADGLNLREIYEVTSYEYRLDEAIARGDLCDFDSYQIECGVDLGDIKIIGKKGETDFDPDRVGERIGPHIARMAKAVVLGDARRPGGYLGPGQTLVFAPCRLSSQAWASALSGLDVPCSAVDYKTPDVGKIFERFKEGDMTRHGAIAAISNLGLCTTGFNHKSIGNILLSRPTQSRLLLEQMLGRGTRLCDGKSACILIDFGWIVDADKIARPADLFLPPGVSPLVRDAARKAATSGSALSVAVADAAKAAEVAAERKRAREEAARDRPPSRQVGVDVGDRSRVKHKSRRFDLFNVSRIAGLRMPERHEGTIPTPASAESAARLREIGFDSADGMSQRDADFQLAHWSERAECGMSSLKQVRYLTRQGYDPAVAAAMTRKEAGAIIGPLQSKYGRRSG